MQRTTAFVFSLMLVLMALATPAAAKRVALVIGNSEYAHTQKLANPENDAKLIASILRRQNFEVLEHTNLGFKAMKRAIKAYTSKLEQHGKETVGLIFFAGHGIQSDGRNYLVPVDAQIAKEGDVEIETISSQALLSGVQFAGNRLNIIILDACRNNPYRGFFRSASRGFARMDAPIGSLVAFSTAPGMVATDGTGVNSPYTAALAKAMVEPGLKIEEVFKRVRATVYGATDGKQVPWESSSIFGDFFFSDTKTSAPNTTELPHSQAAQAWDAAKDTTDPTVLEAFLKEFPSGVFAALARSRLGSLNEKKVAVGVLPGQPKLTIAPQDSFRPGDEFQDCDDCPKMVVLPTGSFMMGSPQSEAERDHDEGPQRRVIIRKLFAVGKFEVTFDEWDACVSDGGCRYRPGDQGWGRGRRPVINVSWDDGKAYISWLSRKTGKAYRLLSEAEWEYAARAGTSTRFQSGDRKKDLCRYANAADRSTSFGWKNKDCSDGVGEKTASVGSYKSNAFGLHDMLGNVSEWAADCWNESYIGASVYGTSRTSGDCKVRVLRGGSWISRPWTLRSADRVGYDADIRDHVIGFRVARTLHP